ncbi:MAG: rhodanese-like domain-containing protein [Acidobacteria bacterium]|jgi:3-mercaptopyruvate sulfurtransferase SseA|nr:rhodanese-like domain-containing protein [Acidobacteriota bacterium]
MKKILSLGLLAVFALFVLTACQSALTANKAGNNSNKSAPKTGEQAHTDDAPRISLADAKKDFDAGSAIFVDTRAEASYKNEHIKGSINIPAETVETRYKEIPTDKKIIAYCS